MFEIIKQLYSCEKVYGPYTGSDHRQRCVLYFSDQTTSSRSYAKLLLEVKLGRRLTSQEEADHVDEDRTADQIQNLQVLTKEENLVKHLFHQQNNQTVYGFACAHCDTNFMLKQHEINERLGRSKSGMAFCSRECSIAYHNAAGFLNYKPGVPKTSQDLIDKINSFDSSISARKIAEKLGIAKSTVLKYRSK